jgi:hypothetical protein
VAWHELAEGLPFAVTTAKLAVQAEINQGGAYLVARVQGSHAGEDPNSAHTRTGRVHGLASCFLVVGDRLLPLLPSCFLVVGDRRTCPSYDCCLILRLSAFLRLPTGGGGITRVTLLALAMGHAACSCD